MAQHYAELINNQYCIRDLDYYNPNRESGRKINKRYTIGFPVVADSYRVANVIISKNSPIITFRLMSMDELCYCNELYIQVILVGESEVYCSLVGNDSFNGSTRYFGDILYTSTDLDLCSPISTTLAKLTGIDVLLMDSKDLVSKYLYESFFWSRVCNLIKDSVMHNSNFF